MDREPCVLSGELSWLLGIYLLEYGKQIILQKNGPAALYQGGKEGVKYNSHQTTGKTIVVDFE